MRHAARGSDQVQPQRRLCGGRAAARVAYGALVAALLSTLAGCSDDETTGPGLGGSAGMAGQGGSAGSGAAGGTAGGGGSGAAGGTAGAGGAGASWPSITIGPKPLDTGTLRADYAGQVSDCSNWPTAHARADTFKTNLGALSQLASAGTLGDVVAMVGSSGFALDVEVGGLRPWDPAPGYDWTQLGENTFSTESTVLELWTQTEWAPSEYGVINTITTDHAIMRLWGQATNPPPGLDLDQRLDLLLDELMDYFEMVRSAFGTGVRLGVIESLGFFNFPGYPHTVASDPDLDFEDFIAALVAKATDRSIPLDHFDIDFSFGRFGAGIADTDPAAPLIDYGRVLAAEQIARSHGLEVGLIYIDCGANDCANATDTEARKRTVRYFAEYMTVGHPDRSIVQTWFPHPTSTGPETVADTYFAMAAEIATILPPSVAYELSRSKDGWTYSGLTEIQDPIGGPWDDNGEWVFTAQSEPRLVGPEVTLDAALYDRVVVRMANDANQVGSYQAELYWSRDGDPGFPSTPYLTAPVANDGAWEIVEFDVGSVSEWSGTITQLQLAPVQTGNDHSVSIDYIRVIAEAAGSCP